MKHPETNETANEIILFECVREASTQSSIDYSLFHEILFSPDGDVELITESIHTYLNLNTLVFIPKGIYHQLVIRGNLENYCRCRLLFADIPELQKLFADGLRQLKVIQTNDRVNCLRQILQDTDLTDAKGIAIARSSLTLLLNEISQNSETECAYEVQNEVVRQAINYIKANIDKKLTIGDIAKFCSTSESALSHVFKREMNQSLYKYIIQVRLITAHQKISEGMRAKMAAYACGFNDYAAFYRQYKKAFGFAPSQKKTIY